MAALMQVGDFFQASARAESREALIEACHAALAAVGYDKLHYFSYPTPTTRGPSTDVVIFTEFPEGWFAHYDAEGYDEIDPIGEWVVQTRLPFAWDAVTAGLELSRRQKRLLADIRDAAMFDGITVPIHGPFGQVNGVTFARGRAGDEPGVAPETLHVARVLAVQFHQAYIAMDADGGDPAGVALTEREHDVLLRLAEGLNNADAAARLGISEHSVKFHLLNASKKLEVNSRVAAVVKAIRLGLIVP
jgi:DNA-binding CsgD family transcriptional regulator